MEIETFIIVLFVVFSLAAIASLFFRRPGNRRDSADYVPFIDSSSPDSTHHHHDSGSSHHGGFDGGGHSGGGHH